MAQNKNKKRPSPTPSTPSASVSQLDDLYDAAIHAVDEYSEDKKPLSFFLVAFRRFFALAKVERKPRYKAALASFQSFVDQFDQLEQNEDAEGVWRAFQNGCDEVERFDRARRAAQTPPTRSIDELIALGVPLPQIAKIYGFIRADGSPDVDAVERRDEWQPPTLADDAADDVLADVDSVEIARLAVNALDEIKNDGVEVDSETVAALESLIPETETPEPTTQDAESVIRREILDGVPVRQIAARHGMTTDEVKARADVLGVVASAAASELPPRIVKQIEAKRDEIASGRTTFANVAASVSVSDRRVTADDVRRVLGSE